MSRQQSKSVVSGPEPQREVASLACCSKGLIAVMAQPLTTLKLHAAQSRKPLMLFSSTTMQLDSMTKVRLMPRRSKGIWKIMVVGRTAPAMSSQIYNTAGAVMAWLRSVTNHVEVSCTWRPDFFLQATPLMAADSIRVGFVSQDAVIIGHHMGCAGARTSV